MSGPSDKARFYMEKAAPHFRELEEKKIFTKDEIRTMVKKKSTFEHKVLSRGTQPVDFARYAAWEINVENLRQKRCRRLRIKGSSAGPGQARIFNIFQRGTEKHPGDLPLWMSYLEYARQAKATNKFKTILTSAIRIKPTEPAIWLYAARWTLESEADMNGARSYMSRAMRMCTRSKEVWIEYAKIEMMYLAKVAKRREILGIDAGKSTEEEREKMDETLDVPDFADSADMIAIPDFKNEALKNSIVVDDQVDSDAPQDPMDTPLFQGAIPIAIYDDARKREFFCPTAAEDFFNMFLLFTQLACSTRILDHVFDSMKEEYPTDASTCNCYIRLPLAGIDPMSPKFPAKLGEALNRLKESLEITKDMAELRKKTAAWIEPVLAVEELDPGLRTVLKYTLRKLN